MSVEDQLVEQHYKMYESRLARIDELLAKADKAVSGKPEFADELAQIRHERESLLAELEKIKARTKEEWQEDELKDAGPMMIWDAVAKKLEQLLEKLER